MQHLHWKTKTIKKVMSYDVTVLLGEFPLHSADILLGDKVVSYLLLQCLGLL